MISLMVLISLVTALVVACIPDRLRDVAKGAAVAGSALVLFLASVMAIQYRSDPVTAPEVLDRKADAVMAGLGEHQRDLVKAALEASRGHPLGENSGERDALDKAGLWNTYCEVYDLRLAAGAPQAENILTRQVDLGVLIFSPSRSAGVLIGFTLLVI